MPNSRLTNTEHLLLLALRSKTYTANNIFALNAATVEALDELWTEVTSLRMSHPNLLRNWYFLGGGSQKGEGHFPINRNGRIEYADVGYSIDGWMNASESSLLVEEDGLLASGGNTVIRQYWNDKSLFVGRTMTASILFERAGLIFTSAEITSENWAAVYSESGLEFYMEGHDEAFSIMCSEDDHVIAVKLELGPTQTLATQDENNDWVLNEVPDFTEQYTICAQYSPITGEFVGHRSVNPNLMRNAFFIGGGSQQGGEHLPINQNGKTQYDTNGFTIDGFSITRAMLSMNSKAVILQRTESENANGGVFGQKLANFPFDSVSELTYSVIVDDRLYSTTVKSSELGESENKKYFLAGTDMWVSIYKDGTSLAIMLHWLRDAAIFVSAMKLEIGSMQTLGHQEGDKWLVNEIPNFAEQYLICKQYKPGTDEFVEMHHTNKNLLRNWYFVGGGSQQGDQQFPINRGGQKKYTVVGNTIDRWRQGSNAILDVNNDGIAISTESNYSIVQQSVARLNLYLGRTLTLSVLTTDNKLFSGTVTLPTMVASIFSGPAVSLHDSKGDYMDIYMSESNIQNNNFLVRFVIFSGSPLSIVAAKLELGPVQTLAHKEGNKWVLNEIPDYAEEYLLCDQYSLFDDTYISPIRSNDNLSDNWYFIGGGSQQDGGQLPINQTRGSMYYGPTRFIDRWKIESGTASIQDDGIVFTAPDDRSQVILQNIGELPAWLVGQVVTLSVLSAPNYLFVTTLKIISQTDSPITILTHKEDPNINGVSCGPFANFQLMRIVIKQGETVKIKAVKVELGTQQTLARKEGNIWVLNDPAPNYTLELMKCLDYYWVSDVIYSINGLAPGIIPCNVKFPVQMKKLPDVTITSYLRTKDRVSNWATLLDVENLKVTCRRSFLTREGFCGLEVVSLSDSSPVTNYAFRVIADAGI